MVKNINHTLTNSTSLSSQFLVDKTSFEATNEKITKEFLANIDVPGFRKGKAPKQIAMEKLNLEYVKNTVFQETIFENYAVAEKSIQDFLEKEDRKVLSIGISSNPTDFIESDEGFKFSLVTSLLPKIDLSKIENISISEPKAEDIKDKPAIADVIAREKEGLLKMFGKYEDSTKGASGNSRIICDITETNNTLGTPSVEDKDSTISLGINQFPPEFENELIGIKVGETKEFKIDVNTKDGKQEFAFKVVCSSVQDLKKETLDELFVSDEKISRAFGSVEAFEKSIEDRYEQETVSVLNNLKTKAVMEAAVSEYKDLELDEDTVKTEITRIFEEVNKEANPSQYFNSLNMMYASEATNKSLQSEITKYVRGEFIASKLLLVIYFEKVTDKITDEEIDTNTKEVMKDPTRYGYQAGITEKVLRDQLFDRLLNYKSTQWLTSNIKIK
jgi:trigger factor